MSDAVNLASRLEAPTNSMHVDHRSEATVALAGDAFAWRELDTVRVKGRTQALKIYDLLALSGLFAQAQATLGANYAEGSPLAPANLTCGEVFWPVDRDRPPAAIFRERARIRRPVAEANGTQSGPCKKNRNCGRSLANVQLAPSNGCDLQTACLDQT